MGIFDFFRKKPTSANEKLALKNIDKFISDKKKETIEKEKQLFETIKSSFNEFIIKLDEKNNVLRNINLDEKKTDPRAKFIIRENLFHYIDNVDKLIKDLKELDSESLHELITDLDSLFINFEQKSRMNFEKATFLIGKELGEIKDTINNFVRNLKKNLDENKQVIENSKILSTMDKKLEELDEINNTLEDINNKIEENNLKIKTIEGDIAGTEIEIEKLKNSEDYQKEITFEAEINIKNEELEKEAYKLKEMIDFKKLANLFHYDSKKMTIINEYKLNFINIFKKDKLLSLVPLLGEANLSDSFVTKKTNLIMQKEKEIEKIKKEFNKKESNIISDLNKQSLNLKTEIDFLRKENGKEEKRKDKLQDDKNNVLALLKENLSRMNVDLDAE